MNIIAFFTNNSVPALGLSPTIRIRNVLTNALIVTDASMSEVGDGHYKYDFTTYDKDLDYAIRCDGGAILNTSERYTYAGNENYIDDIGETVSESVSGIAISGASIDYDLVADAVWDEDIASHTTNGTFGRLVQNISTDILAISASVGDIKLSLQPVGFPATSGSALIGTVTSGDYSDTHTSNDVYWSIEEDGAYDVRMDFTLVDDYVPQSVFIQAHFDAHPSSWIDTYAWNFAAKFWEKINSDTNRITSRSSDGNYQYYLTLNHFEPSGGHVRIRFQDNNSVKNGDVFNLDYVVVIANKILNPSVDYELIAELTAFEVWDEATNAHTVSGSFGELVQDTNTNTNSISADIVVLGTKIDALSASNYEISQDIKRLLGLTHENIFIDNPVYDSDCNLTSARVRIYSNPASVGTANDVIGTYNISAPSTAPGQFTTWSQVRV